uniref:F-box domain-containing protein n=1 Tax=Hordeum vulgare subsp. vulgare TaxID=112509 RepID=A0A8I6YGS0_HORVV
MSSKASPLHGVVDARRWKAERILGRLVIVVHAAFLDAGFIVPRRDRQDRDLSSTCRLSTEVGATASTLSLEYTALQLLPRHNMGAAALRVCTDGRHVIFYLQLQVCSARINTYWACLDALSIAPLLSGDLNGTTRRLLRNDGSPTAALWRKVGDGFSRRIFSDLCREHGVVPGRAPTLMSLPGDAMAAILERLADGKDLLRVESTCTELRRFVADRDRDRQLWMPRYKALRGDRLWWLLLLHGDTDCQEGQPGTSASWKKMFVRATRENEYWFLRPSRILISFSPRFWLFGSGSLELPVDAAACFGEVMSEDDGGKSSTGRRHGHGKAPATGGREKQQGRRALTGTGAVHSPSARYRWKHR